MEMMRFLGNSQADWALDLLENIGPFFLAAFALIGAVATGYAIYLGFMLAKAEDEGKRKEAKSRIIKTVVGLFFIVILTTTLFNPAFYNAILRGTTDRGDRTVSITGMPMNANGRYEIAEGRTIPLNTRVGDGLGYDRLEFTVTPAGMATVAFDSSTGSTRITGNQTGDATMTVRLVTNSTGQNTMMSTGFVWASSSGIVQNFRFNITIIPSEEWAASYPYAFHFDANNGTFVSGGADEHVLYGFTATDKLTDEDLMNVVVNGVAQNNTSMVARAWHERIGWTSIKRVQANAIGDRNISVGGVALVKDMLVSTVIENSGFVREKQDGITIITVNAFWMDTRRPDSGNTGNTPVVIPLPPPVVDPPGGGGGGGGGGGDPGPGPGWGDAPPPVTALGSIWGGTSGNLLPVGSNYRGRNGGGCKHPSLYQPTDWERIMLARVIAGEARSMPLEHQVAVGEVVMRRVMCDNWNKNQNSIYDIIAAPGQYDTFSQDTLQVVQTRRRPTDYVYATEKSSDAANRALYGTTNFSRNTYFQHADATTWSSGGWKFYLDGKVFSNSGASNNWTCRCAKNSGGPAVGGGGSGGGSGGGGGAGAGGTPVPWWVGLESVFPVRQY